MIKNQSSYRKRKEATKKGRNAESTSQSTSDELAKQGLPAGNYCLVGWDMDTTGRRLIDEICQIAAFTPDLQFAQYIMPYGDLSPSARRRHDIRVATSGRYRMLRSNTDNRVLKTKSEVTALGDFIDWLERARGSSDGIILVYHEPRKMLPQFLLAALRRHDAGAGAAAGQTQQSLASRYRSVVRGFCNGKELAASRCSAEVKSHGLKSVVSALQIAESQHIKLESAADRAKLAWQVMQRLCGDADRTERASGSGDAGCDIVRVHAVALENEENELQELQAASDRQTTLRPIFGMESIKLTAYRDRQHAGLLRKTLADGGVDYLNLKTAYEVGGCKGLQELISKLHINKKERRADLLEVLDSHFDPDRNAVFVNSSQQRRGKGQRGGLAAGNGGGKSPNGGLSADQLSLPTGDGKKSRGGSDSPDTTTSSMAKEMASSAVTSSDDTTPRSLPEDGTTGLGLGSTVKGPEEIASNDEMAK